MCDDVVMMLLELESCLIMDPPSYQLTHAVDGGRPGNLPSVVVPRDTGIRPVVNLQNISCLLTCKTLAVGREISKNRG